MYHRYRPVLPHIDRSRSKKEQTFKTMKHLFALLLFCVPCHVPAAQFYVAPDGLPGNDGSINNPWDLQTALDHPAAVQPGDTIWLRGGVYFGNPAAGPDQPAGFISHLQGTAEKPVIVRQFPGERAILDGGNRPHPVSMDSNFDSFTLGVLGSYVWFWGFEITNSNTHSRADSLASFRWRVRSTVSIGDGIRYINLSVHDTGNGLDPFSGCEGCELYGNLIFYNGWSHLGVRGHGEGIYGQNLSPKKYIRDNVVFKQFDSGVILYGSQASNTDSFHLEGNIVFDNGSINDDPNGWGFLLGKNGGAPPGKHFVIENNYFYNRFDYNRSNNIDLGYQSGLHDVVFRDNYSAGYWAIRYNQPVSAFSASGNTLVGPVYPVSAAQISPDSNSIFPATQPPTENAVFVRPNLYEPGRAHIVIYNWQNLDAAPVDLSGTGLQPGESFDIFDVQNLWGPAVASGTFSSGNTTVSLPLNLTEVAPVVGDNVPTLPVHTDPVFNVFLLKKSVETSGTGPRRAAPAERVVVAPNPAHTELNILLPANFPVLRMQVFDATGCRMLDAPFSPNLDIASLPAGYFRLFLVGNGAARSVGFIKH
jgi:hypothetical protein